uniref:Uncharacterized protein n=1 Tax=Neolamprologus brichardi TaxID=32507 RepID=A0A3Q4H0A6_NEOBR
IVATACPLPPSPPPALRENTLPVPEKFSGELDKCGNFLTQRALIFWQQVQAYATDGAKITLMVGNPEIRSVADFSVDFWILAVKTGWEEKALR